MISFCNSLIYFVRLLIRFSFLTNIVGNLSVSFYIGITSVYLVFFINNCLFFLYIASFWFVSLSRFLLLLSTFSLKLNYTSDLFSLMSKYWPNYYFEFWLSFAEIRLLRSFL